MGSLKEQLLLLISTPLYIIIIGAEIMVSHYKQQNTYSLKDTFQNIYMMLLNTGIDVLFRTFYLGVLAWCYTYRFLSIENVLLYWVALVLFEDFMYYWLHRIDHMCRMFWAVHVTHHSSQKFNFTVGFRSSVFEPLYRFVFFLPLAFAGFKPLDIVFVYSATQIWGILIHTEKIKSMGWLEYVLVTPSHHKVHHASNPLYLDRNLGMLLIWWDKLFGTFQPEIAADKYEPMQYGIVSPIEKETPFTIVFHEWQSIWKDLKRNDINWKLKKNYLFNVPGWSHDGSRKTSKELRNLESQQNTPTSSIQ